MEYDEIEIETRENGKNPDKRYAYVVEGMMDEDKLKKLGCLFVIKTGGKFIRKEIKEFIKEVSEVRELVLILDPDGPGKNIEKQIVNIVGPCLTIQIDKKDAIKKGKVGIAETNLEILKNHLRPFIRHDLFVDENLSLDDDDFYDLGLIGPGGKQKRMKLVEKYHLPYTSAKNVEDAMLMLSKSKKEIIEDLENDGTTENN